MMTLKIPVAFLVLLLTLLTGMCSSRPIDIHVKAGEMVALHCPHYKGNNRGDAKLVWTSHTTKYVTRVSSAGLTQMGVVVHGGSLVILSSSFDHQGNYSCFVGNASSQAWFTLTVNTAQSRDYDENNYSKKCYTQESCKLNCPEINTPALNTPNITSNGITWQKEGESFPKDGYFPSVEKKDHGVYTCTRSYLHHGQKYKMTFKVVLDVKPKMLKETAAIMSPYKNQLFYVDLGTKVEIVCKAVTYSQIDGALWLSGTSFVDQNANLPVFYKSTQEINAEKIMLTATLVIKNLSENDLSKNFTCKLESVYQPSSFVTITLAQKII